MTEQAHGTDIEWTHVPGYKGETWNPVRGCTKVSPGCKFCYAETFAERWRGVAGHPYEQGFDLRLVPEKLDEPTRATKPRAYFVNSMSDLFQVDVPDGFIMDTWRVMGSCPRHLFMVLTKRADRMAEWMRRWSDTTADSIDFVNARGPAAVRASHSSGRAMLFADMLDRWGAPPPGAAFPTYDWVQGMRWWPEALPKVWLGVSVEDRKYGLPRIDILRQVPAAVRFLSIEPLLEGLGQLDLTGIHWVIVGGESGPGARPFDIDWAETIVQQCVEQGTPVFLKQLGAVPVRSFGDMPIKILLKSKKGSDEAEWPAHLRGLKQFPKIVRAA